MASYGDPVKVDSRVEIHPGYDLWMQGARYGRVVKMRDGICSVKMDHSQVRRQLLIHEDDLKPI